MRTFGYVIILALSLTVNVLDIFACHLLSGYAPLIMDSVPYISSSCSSGYAVPNASLHIIELTTYIRLRLQGHTTGHTPDREEASTQAAVRWKAFNARQIPPLLVNSSTFLDSHSVQPHPQPTPATQTQASPGLARLKNNVTRVFLQ